MQAGILTQGGTRFNPGLVFYHVSYVNAGIISISISGYLISEVNADTSILSHLPIPAALSSGFSGLWLFSALPGLACWLSV